MGSYGGYGSYGSSYGGMGSYGSSYGTGFGSSYGSSYGNNYANRLGSSSHHKGTEAAKATDKGADGKGEQADPNNPNAPAPAEKQRQEEMNHRKDYLTQAKSSSRSGSR